MPDRHSYSKAIQQTGCSFSSRDSFSGEGNLVVTLFHFPRKLVMSAGYSLFPG